MSGLRHLKLDFYALDAPEARRFEPYVSNPSVLSFVARLPTLLALMPNLKSLSIRFDKKLKCLREVDWTTVGLPTLESIELRNMDIDEQSLLRLLTPSGETLTTIKLNDIFLTIGTWASVFRSLLSHPGRINALYGVHGRRYCDDRSVYSKEDAEGFKELFSAVDERRAGLGLPSMRDGQEKRGSEYFHDFWDRETSMAE